MNPLPYPHIVLFDTPMDLEWTAFRRSLESLFFHELTHAVSLSSRGPFFKVLHKIFGGWVYPTGLNAPMFMVEGVTVSFESLDGFGRANDPLIKQYLRQAIQEDTFLSPFQASGVYDLPPSSSAYYYYGGLFSAYLQENYGLEKYAELWQSLGRNMYFSFVVYRSGFYHMFSKVYGIPFPEAWESFKESLRVSGLEDNSGGIVYSRESLIADVAAGNGRVYVLDKTRRRVLALNPEAAPPAGETGLTRSAGRSDLGTELKLFSADSAAYGLNISRDGRRALVSGYRYSGELARAVVTEYDLDSGRKTGRVWKHLYKGDYFRDGVIGLNSDRHMNNLVFRPAAGGERILLWGRADLVYSQPVPISDDWIALIAAEQGIRRLCFYHFPSGKTYTLRDDGSHGADLWRYIRSLGYYEGKLLFSYNHDDRMYKLGLIDVSPLVEGGLANPPDALDQFNGDSAEGNVTLEAQFMGRDFSGGVAEPVLANGSIYYRASMASWDAVMRYPEAEPGLTAFTVQVGLQPSGIGTQPVPDQNDTAPESRAFHPIKYMNPLNLWLPYPLMGVENGKLYFDGVGIFSYLSDPTDTNTVFLTAGWNIPSVMAPVDISWTTLFFGFPLIVDASDGIDHSGFNTYRRTRVALSASHSWGLGGERLRFSASAGVALGLYSLDPEDGSGAYTWKYEAPYYSAMIGAGISNLQQYIWELFGRGIGLNLYIRSVPQEPTLRFEGILNGAYENKLAMRFTLYGAWDQDGMSLSGTSSWFGSTYFSRVASREYASPGGYPFKWLAGGEAELRVFSFNIQRNLSHIYFNRVFCTLALRSVFYDTRGFSNAQGVPLGSSFRLAQTLILRLGPVVSAIPIKPLTIKIAPNIWGGWKFSNTITRAGTRDSFVWGISLNMGW